jgi:tetratricopeptide (TPR) repeat protein
MRINMKKLLYIFLLPLCLGVSSCEDFLTEAPLSQLSDEKFWKSEADVRVGMAGMYDGLQDFVSNSFIDFGDARSDNFENGGTGVDQIAFGLNNLTASSPQVEWERVYRVISRANIAIAQIPTVPGFSTETQKNNYLGQAYALRAYCYFWAVRVWGDVPLLLEPLSDINLRPMRAPQAEVLASIQADLDKAATLINPLAVNVYEINLGAIYAMQTDVHMWNKEYQKALDVSDKLIKLNRYSLAPANQWKALFLNPVSTKENIFSLYWNIAEDGGNELSRRIGGSNTSNYVIDSVLIGKWEMQKKDIRRYNTYDTIVYTAGNDVTQISKYYPSDPTTNRPIYPVNGVTSDVKNPFYRYADIVLLRAEALNMLDRKPEAIILLNSIRTRAGLKPLVIPATVATRDLETMILDERQFEFFAEAKRWFDLRRTNRVVEVMDPVLKRRQKAQRNEQTGFGDPRKQLFPVGRQALTANPSLTQNAPYSE